MTVETGLREEKTEGRCVLLGLQIDGDGRELLNWALGKVARQGDRVVAVHVCRNSDSSDTSTLSLIKVLDDYLAVYEGFCSLKQVVLVGRLARGTSIQKALVREADLCGAMTVVVGVGKNFSFGGSTSLAKYCSKKLPPTTALIALHNGKIVFERGATKLSPGLSSQSLSFQLNSSHQLHSFMIISNSIYSLSLIGSYRGGIGGEPKLILRNLLHPSVGMDPKVIVPSRKALSDIVSRRLSDVSYGDSLKEEVLNDHHLLVHERMAGGDPGSISVLVRKLPDSPGWPLLRRAVSANPEALKESEARKMSVVQWAMSLPNRSLPRIKPQLDKDSTTELVELPKEMERILRDNSSSCRWFPYEELQSSTSQFSSENLIGKGGSSQVYKGCLPSGQQVAIKLSKLSRDFLLEVDIITTLQHERIVPLTGICIEDKNLFSIYEYFSKGSLEENLHGKRAKPSLPWDMRFKVAIGVAEALSYLHKGCSRPVIHRDVKSSNIILSNEFEPQLSDFNLALWAPTTSSHVTHSDVVGTFGYLAPEYFMYGRVSEKIDVYAFGVVLLELLTGRKPISNENPKGQESLVMWAAPILERGDVMELLDPNLDRKYNEDQMRIMAFAASLCIARVARLRPSMSQILSLLRGEEEVEVWLNSQAKNTLNDQDDEAYPASSIGSHLGLALLDVDDDASIASFEQNNFNSLEEYLRGRWSRSSSFD